jgi:hypothetical protein
MAVQANASGFTVTLPSNSNMARCPQNVGSKYTVTLPCALSFAGESLNDESSWQVAVLSVHYTNNFYNFGEPCTLHILVDAPQSDDVDASVKTSPLCTVASATSTATNDLSAQDVSLIKYALAQGSLLYKPKAQAPREVLYGKVHIPAKHFSCATAVWEEIVQQFNSIFGPRYRRHLRASPKPNGTVTFTEASDKWFVIFAATKHIGKVLGMPVNEHTITVPDSPANRTVTMYKLDTVGTRTPKLDGVQALYVYGDLVDYQFVGDSMLPLLTLVDVEKSPGERVGHTCNPLIYLPVNKPFIDSISIRITDESGKEVPFPDVENVVVRLHFRKVRQPFVF